MLYMDFGAITFVWRGSLSVNYKLLAIYKIVVLLTRTQTLASQLYWVRLVSVWDMFWTFIYRLLIIDEIPLCYDRLMLRYLVWLYCCYDRLMLRYLVWLYCCYERLMLRYLVWLYCCYDRLMLRYLVWLYCC